MDDHKQKLRQEAAKAFMESLDEFQDLLAGDKGEKSLPMSSAADKRPTQQPKATQPHKNLDAFEEALADIDAFMQKKQSES